MERKIKIARKNKNMTIWGTPKTPRTVGFATKTTPEFDDIIRGHASKGKRMITEMLDEYQQAYLEKLEHEKLDKRLNKELREKGQVKCPYCSQTIFSG